MVIRTHFEDKNVFSHCMPSKATMTLICISKMTMSSVIACLQWQQCPHLHVESDNVFSHCMPSKGDNVFICISKTTMSSPQKLQYPFSLCFVGLDVLCLYAFKKRGGEWKWKWKWIKREKKEFQYLHAFTGFTAWICASGWSGKDSARTKLVSYLYFPFIYNKR